MRRRAIIAASAGVVLGAKTTPSGADFSPSPKGKFRAFRLHASQVFPGYNHWWAIYSPPTLSSARPPSLMVFQDGISFCRPGNPYQTLSVLDSLTALQKIPQMVAVFVQPGIVLDPSQAAGYRSDRSFEYDSLGPRYSEFLLKEILPLARLQASWSDDPNDHGIAGHSSGAIAAFTVAWNRPDQFRKVYSANGSFTNIRGGNTYPSLIREQHKRPLRIYLWTDTHDLSRPGWGNWTVANQKLADALSASSYDYWFDFGEGTHDPKYAARHFPEALRWLWRK